MPVEPCRTCRSCRIRELILRLLVFSHKEQEKQEMIRASLEPPNFIITAPELLSFPIQPLKALALQKAIGIETLLPFPVCQAHQIPGKRLTVCQSGPFESLSEFLTQRRITAPRIELASRLTSFGGYP